MFALVPCFESVSFHFLSFGSDLACNGVVGNVTAFLDAEFTGCKISHESKFAGLPAITRVSIDWNTRLNLTADQ